jgi:hypothetical protein
MVIEKPGLEGLFFLCKISFVYIISLQSFDEIYVTAYCEGGWLSLLFIRKERR